MTILKNTGKPVYSAENHGAIILTVTQNGHNHLQYFRPIHPRWNNYFGRSYLILIKLLVALTKDIAIKLNLYE